MRSGAFTLKVVIPSGNDEFWEEVMHPKGINEQMMVDEVKRIFEEHGFDDVEVEVQSIRFERT